MRYYMAFFIMLFLLPLQAQDASKTLIKSFRELDCDSFEVAIPIEKVEKEWNNTHWRTEMEISINEKMGNILKTLIYSGRYSIEIVQSTDGCVVEFPGYKELEKIGKLSLNEKIVLTIRKPATTY
ncbi:MAG TPA: hypothetical protein VJ917_05945 [Saprospiraceae bacterium]|nr:hypothetical protein [Saprospiraceae bacterium]